MTTWWLDWGDFDKEERCTWISTEYTCNTFDELLEWANEEFADVLDGEILSVHNCYIQEAV